MDRLAADRERSANFVERIGGEGRYGRPAIKRQEHENTQQHFFGPSTRKVFASGLRAATVLGSITEWTSPIAQHPSTRRDRKGSRSRDPICARAHNHFNQERYLVTRQIYKQRRTAGSFNGPETWTSSASRGGL